VLQRTAKRFMSRIKWWFITKVRGSEVIVIELGYKKYILSREKAMQLIECLESAEVYQTKYWEESKRAALGMAESYTYHVYPSDDTFSMSVVTDSHYQMAKLAGKPQEN